MNCLWKCTLIIIYTVVPGEQAGVCVCSIYTVCLLVYVIEGE